MASRTASPNRFRPSTDRAGSNQRAGTPMAIKLGGPGLQEVQELIDGQTGVTNQGAKGADG